MSQSDQSACQLTKLSDTAAAQYTLVALVDSGMLVEMKVRDYLVTSTTIAQVVDDALINLGLRPVAPLKATTDIQDNNLPFPLCLSYSFSYVFSRDFLYNPNDVAAMLVIFARNYHWIFAIQFSQGQIYVSGMWLIWVKG